MKVTWLGQAGLLFEADGKKILADPYFSDECKRFNPESYRRMPIDPRYLEMKIDAVVLTHSHLDHTDMPTLEKILGKNAGTLVLAAPDAWEKVRAIGGGNNYVRMTPGSEWTLGGVRFRAIPAVHSDPTAIGMLISCEGATDYITGDTLYNDAVFAALPEGIRAVYLPINGKGNNMNAADAARFARKTGAKYAVPVHFGMFDSMTGEELQAENRVIPKLFGQIPLE